MNLKNFFLKPYPFIFNWKSIVIPFVVTVFILIVFKPFEFSYYSSLELIFWALVFGLIVSFSVLGVVMILKKFFGKIIKEENWKVWKEIVLILLVFLNIVLVIFVLFWIQNPEMNPFNLLYRILTRTLSISIIPILTLLLFEQYFYKRNKFFELQNINHELKQNQKKTETAKRILFETENQKIVFQLDPDKIIFLKSDGNYVEIFYIKDNAVRKELIRNRLKILEKKLPKNIFFRCHKSYIVNLQCILKLEGNIRNMELLLHGFVERIPVSRNNSKDFLQKLKMHR